MKNIKLFEEFITEVQYTSADILAKTPAQLKKQAKKFKRDFYSGEEGNASPEEVDEFYKIITDYLGTDQIVELVGGDTWADFDDDGKELTARYFDLIKSMKNEKRHEGPGGYVYVTGTINGAKVITQYDSFGYPPYMALCINVKDIKKFNLGVDPFVVTPW
tara:strand:+ start:1222 stop:1704 length:483 start_codon:yes stop_codon:yes gene_type:complete